MSSTRLNTAQLQGVVDRSPFNRWLGMKVVAVDERSVTLRITWRKELISSPERQSTHGGVIAALVDCSADYAIAAALGHAVPTIDLHIDYHRAATPGDLVAEAAITHLGSTMGAASARVTDAEGRLIASGRGLYMVAAKPAKASEGAD
ncbi:PaaI family thioesterase [Pseudacidovorax intermedius]|uniref:Thioesterase n=1 Tax=Pseudacidovorax intermedius TaxID=433924 RepID=A0A147H420_9BURK|nr:PaaI family thioesterase [Pseudacidovorax intermedius]KTT24684.1 thioesterase [Pseudacidovorax intermedius]